MSYCPDTKGDVRTEGQTDGQLGGRTGLTGETLYTFPLFFE